MNDRSPSQEPTCADALVGTLVRHGLDRVYCVPGIQNDGFFNALYDAGPTVSAIHARPAWKRALERGGDYAYA